MKRLLGVFLVVAGLYCYGYFAASADASYVSVWREYRNDWMVLVYSPMADAEAFLRRKPVTLGSRSFLTYETESGSFRRLSN